MALDCVPHQVEARAAELEERLAIAMEDAIKGHQWHSELAIAEARLAELGAVVGAAKAAEAQHAAR